MSVRDRAAAERERQAAAAAGRYDETSGERHAAERQQQAGVAFPDSREAIAARASRLLDRHAVSASLVVDVVHEEPLAMPAAYERILGAYKELQAWSFLPRGARAASTVGRIPAHENGRELPFGTGFLVSPSLLLTNHDVLTDAESARRCGDGGIGSCGDGRDTRSSEAGHSGTAGAPVPFCGRLVPWKSSGRVSWPLPERCWVPC